MDHLDWFPASTTLRAKVSFLCSREPICSNDEFLDWPTRQGWELQHCESLVQLSSRAQAWLFFGLLSVFSFHPDAFITSDAAGEQIIDTASLLPLLEHVDDQTVTWTEALLKCRQAMTREVIPLIQDYESHESLTLWNSPSYAVLFSIDVLLETLEKFVHNKVRRRRGHPFQPQSLFPKRTAGIARSLLDVGKCPSLAQRLDMSSSEFYHLMSLPSVASKELEDHSLCNPSNCTRFDVDQTTYRSQHTEDCIFCEDVKIDETELVRLIEKDEIPLISSTLTIDGNITTKVVKCGTTTEYTAISHVWAGGLGNFKNNWLPHCQLHAIHQDVCVTPKHFLQDSADRKIYAAICGPQERRILRWPFLRRAPTTCLYWLDTLCIPVGTQNRDKRKRAINSMGRIYAGATNVLVLDPALSRVSYSTLGDARMREERANILIAASPWMARSWPLQEAALALELYVKFADRQIRYKHDLLGTQVTLESIPGQEKSKKLLRWAREDLYQLELAEATKAVSYESDEDFIKVWNLLAKRTTTYADDVPAVFATLLHKSAGEVLDIELNSRTRGILGSLNRLPLDILCVEQQNQGESQVADQPTIWSPRLPGSKQPVPLLSTMNGFLRRTGEGFLVDFGDSTSSHGLICPPGIIVSGRFVLRHSETHAAYLIEAKEPLFGSKSKAKDAPGSFTLLLLIEKEHPRNPLLFHGVLLTVVEDDKTNLKVRFVADIAWSSQEDRLYPNDVVIKSDFETINQRSPRSILIEMDVVSWPKLQWSRFNAFPYQHLQAQRVRYGQVYPILSGVVWFVAAMFAVVWIIDDTLNTNDSRAPLLAYLPLVIRPFFAVFEGVSIEHASNKWAHHMWAASFWDVYKSKNNLARLYGFVSFASLMLDFVPLFCASIVLVCMIRNGVGTEWWLFTAFPLVAEFGIRSMLTMYLYTQWLLSTLEFQHHSLWVLAPLEIMSSWMHQHFIRSFIAILFSLGAAGAVLLNIGAGYAVLFAPEWGIKVVAIYFWVFSIPIGFAIWYIFLKALWQSSGGFVLNVMTRASWWPFKQRVDREIQLV